MTISGFSDKIPVLLEIVMNKLANFVVSSGPLYLAQDHVGSRHALYVFSCPHYLQVRRKLQNALLGSPVDLAEGTLHYLLGENATASVAQELGEMDGLCLPFSTVRLCSLYKVSG